MNFQFPPKKNGEWLKLTAEQKEKWLNLAYDKCVSKDSGPYIEIPNRTVEIDGLNIEDELSFYCEIGEAVNGPGGYFGRSFHGFDDCLFGGFGLDFPYKIIWKNFEYSKRHLNDKVLRDWLDELSETDEEDAFWLKIRQSWGENAEDFFTVLVDAITSVSYRNWNGWKVELELRSVIRQSNKKPKIEVVGL